MVDDGKLDGKPISQIFADELMEMINKYHDSGLESSQAVGVLEMTKFNLMAEMREVVIRKERPF